MIWGGWGRGPSGPSQEQSAGRGLPGASGRSVTRREDPMGSPGGSKGQDNSSGAKVLTRLMTPRARRIFPQRKSKYSDSGPSQFERSLQIPVGAHCTTACLHHAYDSGGAALCCGSFAAATLRVPIRCAGQDLHTSKQKQDKKTHNLKRCGRTRLKSKACTQRKQKYPSSKP